MNAGWVWAVAAMLAAVSMHAQAGEGDAALGSGARPSLRPSAFAPEAARQAARSTAEQRFERSFIRHAAKVARFEAEASKLAMARAQSPAVREFAAELHQQQSAAAGELQRLLHARGMALPMLENIDRRVVVRLGRLSGARFDREFIEAVVQRQQREKVVPYERALAVAVDPLLREWIERQLPLVRHQKVAAERLRPAAGQRVASRASAPAALNR